jgi:hypothetical protein
MMYCETCNEVHEHELKNPRSGACMCTYLGHKVRHATPEEEKGSSYEERLASNIMKIIGGQQ